MHAFSCIGKFAEARVSGQLWQVCISGHTPPPHAHFEEIFAAVRQGRCSGKNGLKGVGGEKKVRKMKWALAESLRVLARRKLVRAQTISIHQDGRGGRLAIRYRCCDGDLKIGSGVLGQVDLCSTSKDLGAIGIAEGTMLILRKLATKRQCPPYLARSKGALCDVLQESWLRSVKRKVEVSGLCLVIPKYAIRVSFSFVFYLKCAQLACSEPGHVVVDFPQARTWQGCGH